MNTDNICNRYGKKNLFVINLNTFEEHITILKDKINEIKIIYPVIF